MRKRALMAATAAVALTLAACGGDDGGDGAAEGENGEAAEDSGIPEFISIATGGTGGAYYPIGGAAGNLLANEIEEVSSGVAETTGGSVENINLLDGDRTELALAQGDAVYQAAVGEGDFDEEMNIRTIGMAYINHLQLHTTADRGIESFDDLVGARVSVGDAGSATELFTRQVTEVLGYSYDDFGDVQRLPFDDQTAAIRNDQLDVGSAVVAPGGSSIADLASSDELVIIPFSEEEIEAVTSEYPYYIASTIEGGTYQGLDEDVQVLGTWNSWLMNTEASREFAYQVTKVLHENVETLEQGHPAGGELSADNIDEALAPLHPGAIDYFEEEGVEIPEELYPPEWED
jgi:uncharacterized protein